jgi:hypothetical protein
MLWDLIRFYQRSKLRKPQALHRKLPPTSLQRNLQTRREQRRQETRPTCRARTLARRFRAVSGSGSRTTARVTHVARAIHGTPGSWRTRLSWLLCSVKPCQTTLGRRSMRPGPRTNASATVGARESDRRELGALLGTRVVIR